MNLENWFFVCLLMFGCSKPVTESSTTTATSGSNAPKTSSPKAASSSSSSAPAVATSAPASGGTHLAALAVCNLVVSARIAKVCQAMPTPAGVADASQFTMPGTPARESDLFGGVFTYRTAADFDAALVKIQGDVVGKKRAASFIFPNLTALTIVVADGEIGSADADALKKIVEALR